MTYNNDRYYEPEDDEEFDEEIDELDLDYDEEWDEDEVIPEGEEHGSPYDRGGADAYYMRSAHPHYITNKGRVVEELTQAQKNEYFIGYREQIKSGDFKDYGNDD